jgi:hypothetical protein
MKEKGFMLLLFAAFLVSCSHKIKPERPSLASTDFRLDSLPSSEINIPIQINLQPVYALAEKQVDTVFTSPNYPNDWVQLPAIHDTNTYSAATFENESSRHCPQSFIHRLL